MESRYSVINLDALANNFFAIKKHVGNSMIMPIIKANAYGHGLIPIAKYLENCGANYFGVALIEEAIQLRNAGINLPILVLGAIVSDQIPLFINNNIDFMASSIDRLRSINDTAQLLDKKARVHLKVDTGLGRIGVRYANAENFFIEALKLKNIEIIGISSHFATSDDKDTSYMKLQCERFEEICSFFEKNSLKMPIRHIANSGAIMQSKDTHFDMVRPGIMLYGVYPQSWMSSLFHLKPVLSLYARVVYFKVVLENSGVSYGLTWKAKKDTRVITIPIGYGDGYPYELSNKGYALLNGKKHPIVGKVCMDQLMINIENDTAYNGDEVVLIGKSGTQEITINELVDLYGGSPYEFLVLLNNRIIRHYQESIKKNLKIKFLKQIY